MPGIDYDQFQFPLTCVDRDFVTLDSVQLIGGARLRNPRTLNITHFVIDRIDLWRFSQLTDMASVATRGSLISQALDDVNKAAQDDTNGTGQPHSNLRESIRKLTLAVEKPEETLMRHRFEVLYLSCSPLSRVISQLLD